MAKQPAFPSMTQAMKKKRTRREQVLAEMAEMAAVVPWADKLHPLDARLNRIIATVRAKVEHPFRVLKRRLGYTRTRYRGLAKNRAQFFTPFAPGKLFLVRQRLLA